MERIALCQMIWRWHFYAGLFVIPMVLILATTGGFYLFKPQVERWEEHAWQGLPTEGAVAPSAQRDAALAAFPGAGFSSYRLPERPGDAALIHLALPGAEGMRDVFVSPQGEVLGALDPDWRIMEVAHEIHGTLLLGDQGSWLVELAASWAIVMIVTGLYLWWPNGVGLGGGLGGVIWPRLGLGGRAFWRDLHAVTGFWVSAFAMVLLLTGLPWTSVWNSGFDMLRAEMGWVKGDKGWTAGGSAPDAGEHAMHAMQDHSAMTEMPMDQGSAVSLDRLVALAAAERLAFPVLVSPPGGSAASGGSSDSSWTVRSDAQNRPLRVMIKYDPVSGRENYRQAFADKHTIDQLVAYGIAWHEGQLFGWVNQLIGLATALALITLSVSGFVMWRRRKPEGSLGAPALPDAPLKGRGIVLIIGIFFVLLPLFALSIIALWLFDRLALPRMPKLARWLGADEVRAAQLSTS